MSLRAITRKEVADLWREKTLLVAIVVQLFVAGFSTFLLVGLQAVTDPDASSKAPRIDVAYDGPGGFDRLLRGEVDTLLHLGPDEALAAWRDGDVHVVVQERIEVDIHVITLLFAQGDPVATLHVTHLKGLLQDYEQRLREDRAARLTIEPIELESRPGVPPISFAYATLLPLLVLVPVFLSGSVAGDTFGQELQDRTMMLLRAGPVSPATIVFGKLLVAVGLTPLQVLLWTWLFAVNGYPVDVLPVVVLATGLAMVLAGIGVIIAVWIRQEGMTQAAYAAVAIGLGTASLALPADVLNAIALLASGVATPAAWLTLGIIMVLGIIVVIGAALLAARRIEQA